MVYSKTHLVKDSAQSLCENEVFLLSLDNQFILIHTTADRPVVQSLCAKKHWGVILSYATVEKCTFVITNTSIDKANCLNEDIMNAVPTTGIGQLLCILYNRFCSRGDLVPWNDELIVLISGLKPEQEEKLRCLFIEMAHLNALDYKFLDWLDTVSIKNMLEEC